MLENGLFKDYTKENKIMAIIWSIVFFSITLAVSFIDAEYIVKFIYIASVYCCYGMFRLVVGSSNGPYNFKTTWFKLFIFSILSFVIMPICHGIQTNIKTHDILEKQRKIKFSQDSLKIINDSTWTIYDSEIKSERKEFVEMIYVMKKLGGSYTKCGSFEKCERKKKDFCKNESQEILDKIKDEYNYTEYKNCLDVIDIVVDFDTIRKVIYDTIVITKEININDLKIKKIKKGTIINDSVFDIQVSYKKHMMEYIKGRHYFHNSWNYVYENNKFFSWSVYRNIHYKEFKFHRPPGIK